MNTERIEDLKRRIQRDPASIAFAQLGEEYRRVGRLREAIDTCRMGLERHPGYLSARVTLGRALIETGELAPAEQELQKVLRVAPDNLAALRGLADIHYRRDDRQQALAYYQRSLALAPHDSELQQMVAELEQQVIVPPPAMPSAAAASAAPVMPPSCTPVPSSAVAATSALLVALERWHAAILADRRR